MPLLFMDVKRGCSRRLVLPSGLPLAINFVLKPSGYGFIVIEMKKKKNEIRLSSSDDRTNQLLSELNADTDKNLEIRFNYNEEFFIKLPETVTVPHFPIHHDIGETTPDEDYRRDLFTFLEKTVRMVPEIFSGLTYFFDPADTTRPGFFHLYRMKDQLFLFLLRVDLNFRTHYGEIIEKGGNDSTHTYNTSSLFLENDIIPLSSLGEENKRVKSFFIEQHLSDTWIGESGKGYFVQGIWIDQELTRFFSRLFIPSGKRIYPYFPFPCKYQTICHPVADFSPQGRRNHLKLLYQARSFLLPHFEKIQEILSKDNFSEDLPFFRELKARVPEQWNDIWDPLKVKVYLNDEGMKEFEVEFNPK